MSGPGPMSPSTEPDSAVATGSASSAPAGLVSGHLDTGTTPVFSMSGPQGPPTVYVPDSSTQILCKDQETHG